MKVHGGAIDPDQEKAVAQGGARADEISERSVTMRTTVFRYDYNGLRELAFCQADLLLQVAAQTRIL
ncbi:MAG: hypothetical protein JNM31_02325 [Flavobacteriales bacterium]|nr:hypothetical protein [Flavobacteriales bacterium]